jgi:hypothetical protein
LHTLPQFAVMQANNVWNNCAAAPGELSSQAFRQALSGQFPKQPTILLHSPSVTQALPSAPQLESVQDWHSSLSPPDPLLPPAPLAPAPPEPPVPPAPPVDAASLEPASVVQAVFKHCALAAAVVVAQLQKASHPTQPEQFPGSHAGPASAPASVPAVPAAPAVAFRPSKSLVKLQEATNRLVIVAKSVRPNGMAL